MIYKTKEYVDILIKLGITPNQFLFALLIYNKQWKDIQRYMNTFGSIIGMELIQDLINKDLVLSVAPKGSKEFKASELIVTEIFANEMLVSNEDAWEEFFKMYPGKLRVNDNLVAAKGLSFSDEKACKERYQSIVMNNKYEHNNIMALLAQYVETNGGYATMKIDKFVTGEYWKEVEKGRDTHVGPALF